MFEKPDHWPVKERLRSLIAGFVKDLTPLLRTASAQAPLSACFFDGCRGVHCVRGDLLVIHRDHR